MSLSFSFHLDPNSKYIKLRKASELINQFFKTRQRDVQVQILRQFQIIGLSNDITLFDPTVQETSTFYFNLYEFMLKLEHDNLMNYWSCIDVLTNACKNPAAREYLLKSYQFLPVLSRYLIDNLSIEQRAQLLKVMQDLSIGIKISWQIPELPKLLKILSNLILLQDNRKLAVLALAVLVNLCYKNLPALYNLVGNVDVNKLVEKCLTFEGTAPELYTSKLLIILDKDKCEEQYWKLLRATFRSIEESFCENNTTLLRQVINFYFETQELCDSGKRLHELIKDDYYYNKQVSSLLYMMEEENGKMKSGKDIDSECMQLLLQFLLPMVEKNFVVVQQQREFLIRIAMKYMQNEIVSKYALDILYAIVINMTENSERILEPLLLRMPIFVLEISTVQENNNLAFNQKATGLVKLIRAMISIDDIRDRVLKYISEDNFDRAFSNLLGDTGDGNIPRASRPFTATPDAVVLYVNIFELILDMSVHEKKWMAYFTKLLGNQKIHMVLSQALLYGSKEIKSLVLQIAGLEIFPQKSVSQIMYQLQKTVTVEMDPPTEINELGVPILNFYQNIELDNVLNGLRNLIRSMKFSKDQSEKLNVQMYDVMELYEYKLNSAQESEKMALASIESYSERYAQLQLRVAQLAAEAYRYQQLLLNAEQARIEHEQYVNRSKSAIEQNSACATFSRDEAKVTQSTLIKVEREMLDMKFKLFTKTKEINAITEENAALMNKYNEFKEVIKKCENNGGKLIAILNEKDNRLKAAKQTVEELDYTVKDLEIEVKQKQADLRNVEEEIQRTRKEAFENSERIDELMQDENIQKFVESF